MECSLLALTSLIRFRKLRLGLTLVGFCVFSAPLSAAVPLAAVPHEDIRNYILWYRNYDSPAIRALVLLAFEKTPEYGEYRIMRSEELSQGRVLKELTDGESHLVDIANMATSADRESILTAIPVPVDGGLLGFRVCVVLPESLPKFVGIKSLHDLRKRRIRIGQGSHWPDTSVLEANGIPVVTHSRYELLFGMLRNKRFECFARGVSEVLYDLEMERDSNLVIEPDLLIAYPMPSYIFVGPNDQETAHRLQLGFERAILDGSFNEFLKRYYSRAVKELHLDRRTLITLDNPYLSEESRYVGRKTFENLRRRLEVLSH